jgi:carbonic anhydrase
VEELLQPAGAGSPNLRSIVNRVRPALVSLLDTEFRHDRAKLIARGVRANVAYAANHLRYGSGLLEQLMLEDGLRVVGAEYSVETGEVEFFEGVGTID